MFKWLKKNDGKNLILTNWDIGYTQGFKKIQNPDSVQYVNEDDTKVIYFSLLTVSGNSFVTDIYSKEPKVVEDANGWQLKSTKKFKDQILVCVVSVANQDDIEWARTFFDSIKAIQSI